ncbi:MAG: hypothetical protein JJU02_16455 [Cryomorphaceae bacterium]|nr:hypothetical protein [Cryomorphaceae bacterium]
MHHSKVIFQKGIQFFVQVFFVISLVASCGENQMDSDLNSTSKKGVQIKESDSPMRAVAKQILLDGKIYGEREAFLFPIMDSILDENKSVRSFYFPVLLEIIEHADGYVAEGVGAYLLAYMEKYSDDFFTLEIDDLLNISRFVAFEVYVSNENPIQSLHTLRMETSANCDVCREQQADAFALFFMNLELLMEELESH